MSVITGSYSAKKVVVMIGDHRLVGMGAGDDAVMIEPINDDAVPTVGADGGTIVSLSADDAHLIKLKLLVNSPTHKYFTDLLRKQKSDQVAATFNVSVQNTNDGEGGSSPECVITKRPSKQYGRNASEREWEIFAPCWAENEIEYSTS